MLRLVRARAINDLVIDKKFEKLNAKLSFCRILTVNNRHQEMARKYINEAHKAYSEALQKEITQMSRNPLSAEQKEAQMERNNSTSKQSNRVENE